MKGVQCYELFGGIALKKNISLQLQKKRDVKVNYWKDLMRINKNILPE